MQTLRKAMCFFACAFVWGGIILSPDTVYAESKCPMRGKLVTKLKQKFLEAPAAFGLTSMGHVLELLTSKSGESWTIALTLVDGTSCPLHAGKGWRKTPPLENIVTSSSVIENKVKSSSCSTRGSWVQHLWGTYSEKPVAMGYVNGGGLAELWSTKTGETWTVTIAHEGGNRTCFFAHGENWETIPEIVRSERAA